MRIRQSGLLSLALILSLFLPAMVRPITATQLVTAQNIGESTAKASIVALGTGTSTTGRQAQVRQSLSALPLYFVENKGQTDRQVAFYIQGSDKTIYFTPRGVTFALTAPVLATCLIRRHPCPARRGYRHPR
jgi:hypothetical protein